MWTYVVAINAANERVALSDSLDVASAIGAVPVAGRSGRRSILDWRAGTVTEHELLAVTLAPRDWAYWVVAPDGRRADEGDLTKYVTVPTVRP